MAMTIELPSRIEDQLRDLALRQGRELGVLLEEAVREYLEAAAITDLDAADVAESQVALLGELRGVPAWKGGGA
jgi:predicted transcriptional regulator